MRLGAELREAGRGADGAFGANESKGRMPATRLLLIYKYRLDDKKRRRSAAMPRQSRVTLAFYRRFTRLKATQQQDGRRAASYHDAGAA